MNEQTKAIAEKLLNDLGVKGISVHERYLVQQALDEAVEQAKTIQRDENYSRGVTAGKLEACNYTAEERERYGKWAEEDAFFLKYKNRITTLLASNEKMREALESIDVHTEGYVDGAPDASEASKLANIVNQIAIQALKPKQEDNQPKSLYYGGDSL